MDVVVSLPPSCTPTLPCCHGCGREITSCNKKKKETGEQLMQRQSPPATSRAAVLDCSSTQKPCLIKKIKIPYVNFINFTEYQSFFAFIEST